MIYWYYEVLEGISKIGGFRQCVGWFFRAGGFLGLVVDEDEFGRWGNFL